MQKWEYKTISNIGAPLSVEYLNRLGKHGWELVAMVRSADNTVHSVFKRPLSLDDDE